MASEKEVGKLQGRRIIAGNTPRDRQVGTLSKDEAEHRAALERIIQNGIATRVRILASHDSCPVCRAYEGVYAFGDVPALPLEGCSHPQGCRCHYEPVLDMRGP
jgi:hypothetical protein